MRDWFLLHPRKTIKLLVLIIILGFVIWMTWMTKQPAAFPINQIIIKGAAKANQVEVKAVVETYLTKSFIGIDVQDMQKALERLKWLQSVAVYREWPDTLLIDIFPQHIIAKWNQSQMLNALGEVYDLSAQGSYQPQLPHLYGAPGTQIQVLDYFQRANDILAPLNLDVVEMHLLGNNDWRIVLDNGIKIALGHQQILTRLQHFVDVYKKVFAGKASQAKNVDLRYPNGMAVQWGKK